MSSIRDDSDEEVSQFSNQYKYTNRTIEYTQEQHRQLFLKRQKDKRTNAFDEKRNLCDLLHEKPDLMECETETVPNRQQKRINRAFRYKMMGAEWLTEIPPDLEENWIVKPCPGGTRYLVVAHKGYTSCYLKNGRFSFKFRSNLPGGSRETLGHRFTVLDCIYNKASNTNFIFDVFAWNNVSLVDVDANMRFSWLKSKFAEDESLLESCSIKKTRFSLIEALPAQRALIQDQMSEPFVRNEVELCLDGLLFYHKEGHYLFGNTPLVGWLKPFMLQEVLGIDVHHSHLATRPENYTNQGDYIKTAKVKKRHGRKRVEEVEMEEVETLVQVETENIECDN